MNNESKIASEATQANRFLGSFKIGGTILFTIVLSIPLVNLIAGMFFFIKYGVGIFAMSAQRSKDFAWLICGGVACLFGFALPALCSGASGNGWAGWVLEPILNFCVHLFIVRGRLGHLFEPKISTPQ